MICTQDIDQAYWPCVGGKEKEELQTNKQKGDESILVPTFDMELIYTSRFCFVVTISSLILDREINSQISNMVIITFL